MGYIFNVGDVVEIIDDPKGCCEAFKGLQGVVKDVIVGDDSNTIYGVDLYESRFIYFLARDLKEVK